MPAQNQKSESTPEARASSMQEALAMLPSREQLLEEEGLPDNETEKVETKKAAEEVAMKKLESDNLNSGEKEDSLNKEHDAISEEALKRGWKPKEDYQGKPEYWRTAREFMDRTHMMDKIATQNTELRAVRKKQDELLTLLQSREHQTSEDRAEKYKKMKEDALSEGEVDAAFQYETEYQKEKKKIESFREYELKQQANSEIPYETMEFMEKNKEWFNDSSAENSAMKQYAIQVENSLLKQYPDWTLSRRFEEVEQSVKGFFYDKFE